MIFDNAVWKKRSTFKKRIQVSFIGSVFSIWNLWWMFNSLVCCPPLNAMRSIIRTSRTRGASRCVRAPSSPLSRGSRLQSGSLQTEATWRCILCCHHAASSFHASKSLQLLSTRRSHRRLRDDCTAIMQRREYNSPIMTRVPHNHAWRLSRCYVTYVWSCTWRRNGTCSNSG